MLFRSHDDRADLPRDGDPSKQDHGAEANPVTALAVFQETEGKITHLCALVRLQLRDERNMPVHNMIDHPCQTAGKKERE